MKYFIMCEGPNEVTIMNILLEENKLIFSKNDLIGGHPYHTRNIIHPAIVKELLNYNKPVEVLRIGDTQTDKIEISKELSHIITKSKIKRYCTKLELEVLLLINEGLYSTYLKKCKNKKYTKEYAKDNIVYKGRRYDQTSEFFEYYYGGKRVNTLVANLKEYKRVKKHYKNEEYLADLLKK